MVCIHGFTDTWRTWELVLGELERRHDVLAPTLSGHAGGPPLRGGVDDETLPAAVERAMDEAGFETAHIVGNSLGGFVALQLAARGRAESVLALAPAGGWAAEDRTFSGGRGFFMKMYERLQLVEPHTEAIVASAGGRRRATEFIAVNYEHIPADLVAHQIRGAARCDTPGLVDYVTRQVYALDADSIACPARIVWGTEDRILPWPAAAVRFREEWLPDAEWIELEGVGHCPQLDVPRETAELILGFAASGRGRRAGVSIDRSRAGGAAAGKGPRTAVSSVQ
jgi:pimeloyl-ACP methyl ester carboxylesterase